MMKYSMLMAMLRRSTSAALVMSFFAAGSDSMTFAADRYAPTQAIHQPVNSDEIYRRAGDRLAMQLQQHRFVSQTQNQQDIPAGEPQAPAPPADNAAAPAAPANAAPAAAAEPAAAEPAKAEPWSIVSLWDNDAGGNWLKDNGLTLGGWVQMGYQNRPDGAFTGNGPFLNQKEHNNFNLNQMYLYMAKVADGTKGIDWGFRVDGMYGVDGNEAQSFGNVRGGRWDFLNGWGGPNGFFPEPNQHGPYEFALPQVYGEIAMDTLSIKAGHFYTPIGYEVITSPDNFFLSRQITFYNSEPFTHTGALATWKAADELTFIAGWTLGWDTGFSQFSRGNNGIIGFTYNANEKTSLIYAGAFGNFGWRGTGTINSFILSYKATEKLTWVSQFDVLATDTTSIPLYGGQADFQGPLGLAGDSTGFINYLFYEIDEQWKLGARFEWYKADGTSYNTMTYGVNYKPTQNLTIRPEMRHLWSNDPVGALPAINSVYGQSDVFGIDVIFKF